MDCQILGYGTLRRHMKLRTEAPEFRISLQMLRILIPPLALGCILYLFSGFGIYVDDFLGFWGFIFDLPCPNHSNRMVSLAESSINQVSVLKKVCFFAVSWPSGVTQARCPLKYTYFSSAES